MVFSTVKYTRADSIASQRFVGYIKRVCSILEEPSGATAPMEKYINLNGNYIEKEGRLFVTLLSSHVRSGANRQTLVYAPVDNCSLL